MHSIRSDGQSVWLFLEAPPMFSSGRPSRKSLDQVGGSHQTWEAYAAADSGVIISQASLYIILSPLFYSVQRFLNVWLCDYDWRAPAELDQRGGSSAIQLAGPAGCERPATPNKVETRKCLCVSTYLQENESPFMSCPVILFSLFCFYYVEQKKDPTIL